MRISALADYETNSL